MSKKSVKNYKEMSEQFNYEMAMTFLNDSKYKYDKPYFNDIHNEVTCEISVNGNYDFRLWFFMEKGKYEIEIINYAKETSKTILKSNNLQMIIGDLFLYVASGKYEKEINKPAYKIINNNIDKTMKYSYNTISIKSSYFIADGFLYETDLSKVLRKEKLSDCLNLKELNNKLFTPPILKQIQAYHKDGFKIVSIQDENNILTIKFDNGSIIAKIQAKVELIENIHNLSNIIKKIKGKQTAKWIEYNLSVNDLIKIKTACQYVSNDDFRPALQCVNFNGNKIISTNGLILYADNLDCNIDQEINIPAIQLLEYFKANKNSTEAVLKICGEYAEIDDFDLDLCSHKFPKIDNIVNKNFKLDLGLNIDIPKKIKIDKKSEIIITNNKLTVGNMNIDIKSQFKNEFKLALSYSVFNVLLQNNFNFIFEPDNMVMKTGNIILMPLNYSFYNPAGQIKLINNKVNSLQTDLNYIAKKINTSNEYILKLLAGIDLVNNLLAGREINIDEFKIMLKTAKCKLPVSIYKKFPDKIKLNSLIDDCKKLTDNEKTKLETAIKKIIQDSENNIAANNQSIENDKQEIIKDQLKINQIQSKIDSMNLEINTISAIKDNYADMQEQIQPEKPMEVNTNICNNNLPIIKAENNQHKNAKMILEISSGTIANITGLTNYSDIEQFVNDLIIFSSDKVYSSWIEIYQDYVSNKKPIEPTKKPTQSLLPVLYSAGQKTTVKTTKKLLPIKQIAYRQVLSLPAPKQEIELAEIIPMEGSLGNCQHLDNFFELYQARLKQKRTEKRLSKDKFSFIPALSSVAIMLFVMLHCFVSIPAANSTMDDLANIGKTKEQLLANNQNCDRPIKTMLNLSYNALSGTLYQLDNKPPKNIPFDGLNLISLVMVFGITNLKRKEENMDWIRFEVKITLNNGVKTNYISWMKGENYDEAKNLVMANPWISGIKSIDSITFGKQS